ncbi:hypothetical protein RYX36_031162, partial [Vicia faba]
TETTDFQKDLRLDSLDRVELIMTLEEEFSIEILDEKDDKLTCCKDVAKYIASEDGTFHTLALRTMKMVRKFSTQIFG